MMIKRLLLKKNKLLLISVIFLYFSLTSVIADEIHVYPIDNVDSVNNKNVYYDIQSAINEANNKDTIYIHTGKYLIYNTLNINKSINIIGVGNNTHNMIPLYTNNSMTFMKVNSDHVSISNLKLNLSEIFSIAIQLNANHTILKDNIIDNNTLALYINSSSNHIINNNYFSNNTIKGLITSYTETSNIKIINNVFNNNEKGGITLFNTFNYTIINNSYLNNNDFGINIISTNNNLIQNNIFKNNIFGGIYLSRSKNSTINKNEFLGKGNNGIYVYESINTNLVNNKISNYNTGVNLSGNNENTSLIDNIFTDNENNIIGYNDDKISDLDSNIAYNLFFCSIILIVLIKYFKKNN